MATILPTQITATVAGGVNVTVTAGPTLTPYNCGPGFPVVLNKEASFVGEWLDTTHFTLMLPVTNGTGLTGAISSLTSQETKIATLNVRAAELMENLSALDANGRGLFYYVSDDTGANDPNPTYLRFNAPFANPEDIDEMYIDVIDANELNVAGVIDLWGTGTVLTVRSISSNAYVTLKLTQAPTNEGPNQWRMLMALEYVDSDGLIIAGEAVAVEWNRQGSNSDLGNPKGAYNAGTEYVYRDMVTDQSALWIYHNAAPSTGNSPPTLPITTNGYWQIVGGLPTIDEILAELGVGHITISTDPPSGGAHNDLHFKVPV